MALEEQRHWFIEKLAGRLIEIRVEQLDSVVEVLHFSEAIQETALTTPNAVLIVDLRTPQIFSDAVGNAVVQLMSRVSKVRRKTAILIADEHALFSLQLRRLVREVGDPTRQVFSDPAHALSWLAYDLDELERARAREFVRPRPSE